MILGSVGLRPQDNSRLSSIQSSPDRGPGTASSGTRSGLRGTTGTSFPVGRLRLSRFRKHESAASWALEVEGEQGTGHREALVAEIRQAAHG